MVKIRNRCSGSNDNNPITSSAGSRYDKSKYPDWLKSLSDDELDKYFEDHPNSKYAKNSRAGKTDDPTADDPNETHSKPLIQRLTFKGWASSAPKKDVRKRKEDYSDMMDDLSMDNADIQDIISDLKEQNQDDKESRNETNSPRRKKRYGKKIEKRSDKISKLKSKVTHNQQKIHNLRKRVKLLDKELKSR